MPVTTVTQVGQIFAAFGMTFMDSTAWQKQKCCMTSGSIQKKPIYLGLFNKLQPG
jgi:hypothetical protein